MAINRGQFKPGQSGNPAGKPKGARDKRTALRKLLEPHSEALVQKAVDMALEGDTTALRLCLERIIPALRTQEMPVSLGYMSGTLSEQAEQIIGTMAAGEITPSDAALVLSAMAAQARIRETDELAQRIRALENPSAT